MMKGKVLAFWHKDTCGVCAQISPIVMEFAAEKDLPVMTIDIASNDPLAERFGVDFVPCLMLLVNGTEINRTFPTSRADLDRLLIITK